MDSGGRSEPFDERPPRADGSGHRVPEGQAPEEYGDHRGRGDHDEHDHRSRWPLVAAAGAAGLYGGAAVSILGLKPVSSRRCSASASPPPERSSC